MVAFVVCVCARARARAPAPAPARACVCVCARARARVCVRVGAPASNVHIRHVYIRPVLTASQEIPTYYGTQRFIFTFTSVHQLFLS